MKYQKEKSPEFNNAILYNKYALKFFVYQTAVKRLISYFQKYFYGEPQRFLDIACGTGIGLRELRIEFPKVNILAIDQSPVMIEFAKEQLLADDNIEFLHSSLENLQLDGDFKVDGIFCSAAFWYFKRNEALKKIEQLLSSQSIFLFNISEPAINFNDGKYDDRFLQTMVEVLDDFDIVFHRDGGFGTGRLKLSYEPPTTEAIKKDLENNQLVLLENNIWQFTKNLDELKEFYMIPGFGTKAFRELTDDVLKEKILLEIIKRLRSQSIKEINFRWAEFVVRHK